MGNGRTEETLKARTDQRVIGKWQSANVSIDVEQVAGCWFVINW